MRSLAITSGKGGTGKTAITINLGLCLAEMGHRVLIFDGDLGLANVDIQLGLRAPHNLHDVVQGDRELEEVVVEGPSGLRILPGASGIVEMEHLSTAMHRRLLDGLQRVGADLDVVLIDTGAGISDSVQLMVTAADEVVVVMTPDPAALIDGYAMIKILVTRCGHSRVQVVVNQSRSAEEAQAAFERLRRVASQFLAKSKIEMLGFIHLDRDMQNAVRSAKPVVHLLPESKVADELRALAVKWLALPGPHSRDRRAFWERILSASGPTTI